MASVQSSVTGLAIYVVDAYVPLCMTDSSFDLTIESDDITDMCSSGWRETKSQIRSVSFSGNGVFDSSSTAYAKLKARFVASTDDSALGGFTAGWGQCVAQVTDADADTYSGIMQINSLGQASSFNQEVRFSADFQFSGTPTIA